MLIPSIIHICLDNVHNPSEDQATEPSYVSVYVDNVHNPFEDQATEPSYLSVYVDDVHNPSEEQATELSYLSVYVDNVHTHLSVYVDNVHNPSEDQATELSYLIVRRVDNVHTQSVYGYRPLCTYMSITFIIHLRIKRQRCLTSVCVLSTSVVHVCVNTV